MIATTFAATGRLLRLALRRDRLRLAVWFAVCAVFVVYQAMEINALFSDPVAMASRAALMHQPTGAFVGGPGYGLDDYTLGPAVANELTGMLAVVAALVSSFIVVRHTRAEEEHGQAELVRAAVVGRRAPLTAALLTTLIGNATAALVITATLVAGYDLPAADSAAVGLGVGLTGLVFATVAAVTAQIASTSRAANSLAGLALALTYVLRGIGDAAHIPGGNALSWCSPIGWAQQTRAYVDLRWWPLALSVLLALALTAVAYLVADRRDVGSGLMSPRRGRARAGRTLRGPLGLVVRLERTAAVAWVVSLALFAVFVGSLTENMVEVLRADAAMAAAFAVDGQDPAMTMLSHFLQFFAMAVAVFAVVTIQRMGREEDTTRTATVLAGAVGRTRWLATYLIVTAFGAALALLGAGLGLGAAAAPFVGDSGLVLEFTLAALAHLPMVMVFTALAALAHATTVPGWSVWAVLSASVLVGIFGGMYGLPTWLVEHAPFALTPAVPAAALDPAPIAGITLVAAALLALAGGAYRRRDLRS